MARVILIVVATVLGVFATPTLQGQDKANKETIKQAEELFEQGKFAEAKKLYNQLVTYYPKDAGYNYKLGACMLFTESDKQAGMKYLEYAATQPDVEPEAYYYLGKGYHYNYKFNEAAIYYSRFKAKASSKDLKRIRVDQDLRAANNGFKVLKNVSEPRVFERKTLSNSEFYMSYRVPDGVKLLRLPSFLQSDEDESMEYSPVTAIQKGSDTIIVAGFSKSKDQTDLFRVITDEEGNGTNRLPITELNSEFDEGYPYFDKKQNILYFSSKGYNSMGGFDLFRAKYDEASGTFGAPENMDYAYNTPDDDFLYIPTGDGKAYFSSSRNNDAGFVTVFLVDTANRGLSQALLVGNFSAEGSKVATITIEDSETGQKLPAFDTRAKDGFYMSRVKSSHRYRFLVEPENSDVVHAGVVEIPEVNTLNPLKQEMYIVADGDRKKLVIKNLFDEKPDAKDQELISEFLAELGKLDSQAEEVEKNIALFNEEIIADLDEQSVLLSANARDLVGYTDAAYSVAQQKSEVARQDIATADRLEELLPEKGSPDYSEKVEEVNRLKEEAVTHAIEAASALAYANTLEELGNERQQQNQQTIDAKKEVEKELAAGNRNGVVQAYLKLNDEVSVNKKPVETQAEEALTAKANKAKREASAAKQRYEDLYDEEERLKKSIAFTLGQADQAKKAKMKKQLENDLANMRADLQEVSTKVTTQYGNYKKKEAIAEALSGRASIISQEVLAAHESGASLSDSDRKAIASGANEVYTESVRYADRDTYNFAEEPVLASNDTETESPAEEVSESDVNTDLIQEEPEVLTTTTYNTAESPYTDYYEDKEESVKGIEDPYLRAMNEEALYTAKADAISAEIDFLILQEPSDEFDARMDELREERNQVNAKVAAAEEILANSTPNSTQFQPTEGQMSYPSIQDLEDQYYFEFDDASATADVDERMAKTNAINERYLADLEATRIGLESAVEELDPNGEDYRELGQEVEAIKVLEKKKRDHIEFNTTVINGVSPTTFAFTNAADAFLANNVEATATETTPSANTEESSAEERIDETEFVAEETVEEETFAQEEQPIEQTTEPVTAEVAPEVDENGVPAGGFKYFSNAEEVRKAPVYTGKSPYNATYESRIDEAGNNPNELTASRTQLDANEEWVEEINKEIESLSYLSANASNESTKEVLEDKISSLRTLKSERQAEVNRLNALETTLVESGYVAEEPEEVALAVPEEEIIQAEPQDPEVEEEPAIADTPLPVTEAEPETVEDEEPELVEDFEEESSVEPTEELASLEEPEESTEEPLSFEEDGIAAVADGTENDIEESLTQAENNAALAEPVTEEELVQDELETLDTYLASYGEEAASVQEDLNDTDAQIEELQNQLNAAKKKKEKKALQKEIDYLTERRLQQAEVLDVKRKKATSVEDAKQTLMANPLAERPSAALMAQADKLSYDAQIQKQEIQDQENEIGAMRKKKKRRKALEALEPQKAEANAKLLEAEQAMELAKAVEEAEVLTLKTTTAFSREIIVELPETDRTLTEQEQAQIKSTPEYTDYNATKESFGKSIQEADVLYSEARNQEQQGRNLLAQADASSGEQSDSLRSAGNEEIRLAVNKRKRARALEREAYYAMNMANQDLLAIEDDVLRTDVIALSQGGYSQLLYSADGDIDVIPATLASDIFKKEEANLAYYSDEKPIPVDVQLPQGVVYKVQVGAFSRTIPNETFKGFAPIVGEKTASGLTRYSAGLFKQYNNANSAKDEIRALGYSDAFVVAYRNGDRITLAEARALEQGTVLEEVPAAVATNQPDQPLPVQDRDVVEIASPDELDVQSVNSRASLFYTVQIGVYSSEVSPSALFNISPINSETTTGGLIRYSTGVFSTVAAANAARDRIRTIGIQDAFVTAYSNGERISVEEARATAANGVAVATPQTQTVEETAVQETTPETNIVTPQEATEVPTSALPPSTAESENAYRVKVGPYPGLVPVNEAGVILGMNSVGINIDRTEAGTVYFIGNYATEAEAQALLQVVKSKGINDSEVVKFENGTLIE